MKILYIHQYFTTPDKPGGTRSYWIARELIKNGHEVTMLTANGDIKNKVEYSEADGIKVISLKVSYDNSMGIFKRLQSFVSFMWLSTKIAYKQKDINLVIATSTPLTIGFPALILKKFKKIPYLFEVRDLWPEVPIQMGAIKNKVVINVLKWFEKTIYKNAKHVVALSPGMEKGVLDTGIPQSKVNMIPNMAKIDQFWTRDINLEIAKEHNINTNTFKIVYFGALGKANAIEYILDSAKLLKEEKDIEFLILGGGAMETLIKETVKKNNLTNVKFLGNFKMAVTSEIVNMCQVSLVTFDNLPILATNSPNKLFDSLSAGKPIIVNSPGWTKKLAEDNNCGVFVDPTSPEDFKQKIIQLKNAPEKLVVMGKNSRQLAETKYDKSILCKEFVDTVNNIDLT